MIDELCRRLYWWAWRHVPTEQELLARMTPEQREMLESIRRALGGHHG